MTTTAVLRSTPLVSTTQRYDDGASARRVLGGDVDAFEGIGERWQGPLINLAYRYCRNRGEAEELAQEAFMKVFKGLGKWRQDSRFSTWLYAVATNHYRSAMRRRRPITCAALILIALIGSLLVAWLAVRFAALPRGELF